MNTPVKRQPVAVVTGGSSGIGLAFVKALHRQGYQVITCARDPQKLRQVAAECPGVDCEICDVSNRDEVFGLAERVVAKYGAVDQLVNNAGGLIPLNFADADLKQADLSTEIRINLEGAVTFTAAFLPALKKGTKASIVFVTSGYALAPSAQFPLYSAAKAGLRSFAKGLRRQLKPLSISVTEVAPPLVDTPSVAHRSEPKLSPENVVQQTLEAARRGKPYVYPGSVRLLPLMLRLFPGAMEDMVAKT